MPAAVEVALVGLRLAHPSWGPRRLVFELAERGVAPVVSESVAYRALARLNWSTRPLGDRETASGNAGNAASRCQLWQMNVVGGFALADGSRAKALTGIDDHCRFCVSARLMLREQTRPVCDGLTAALRAHRRRGLNCQGPHYGAPTNHLNGAMPEELGWRQSSDNGEIVILKPGRITANRPDYLTFDPTTGEVVVWDTKYSSSGRFPSGDIPGSKMTDCVRQRGRSRPGRHPLGPPGRGGARFLGGGTAAEMTGQQQETIRGGGGSRVAELQTRIRHQKHGSFGRIPRDVAGTRSDYGSDI
jgi:hypothetical protein